MVIYLRNDKAGLEFLARVMSVYPEYKKEKVTDILYQTRSLNLVEVP